MKYTTSARIVRLIALIFGALLLCSAKRGDIAVGEIVSQDDKVLQLNTAPCTNKPHMVTFTFPWKTSSQTTKQCPKKGNEPGRTYTQVQVEQMEQPDGGINAPPK